MGIKANRAAFGRPVFMKAIFQICFWMGAGGYRQSQSIQRRPFLFDSKDDCAL